MERKLKLAKNIKIELDSVREAKTAKEALAIINEVLKDAQALAQVIIDERKAA